MGVRTVGLLAVAACRISSIDVAGKACPCPNGWYCDPATTTCSLTQPADALIPDEVLTYRDAVLADMPMGYWRLDDAGAIARDEIGHYDGTYNGTCVHGATGALTGDADTAVKLDGSTCKILLPSAFAFLGTAPLSVEAWIQEPVAVSGYRVVFAESTRDSVGPIDGYNLVDSGSGVFVERVIAMGHDFTASTPHLFGPFVYLVAVYDGASLVLYIDGMPGASVADTRGMFAYTANGVIGADLSDNYFLGTIDEVAVYDHVLPPARIAVHFDLGTRGPQ